MSTKDSETNNTRRRLIKAGAGVAALGAVPNWFIRDAWADSAIGNYPVRGPVVRFGFNVPLTGVYADEGADELRAYKLAVRHLNHGGGMLETLQPSQLTGSGVLGKRVEAAYGDTRTTPDKARISAQRLIEHDRVIMFSGGSSSAVAIAQQQLAQEAGVIFMAGLSHSNDTTGKDRRRYGFRHFFNAHQSAAALAPMLAAEYGKDRRAFHLTADYTWGHTQYASIRAATEAQGWQTIDNIATPLTATDFSAFLDKVQQSKADVLVLNHYGRNMIDSMTQAVAAGIRDLERNGRQMAVVVPLYSRLMALGAGTPIIEGVLGTCNWHWTLTDPGSRVFVETFAAEYGFPPSQAAHTCYVQTLLYANAVEMAGTFYPPEVIRALEDFEFEGAGHPRALYRAADHQCFKDVLVMRGKSGEQKQDYYDLLEVVAQVPREQVTYAPDHRLFVDPNTGKAELGPYVPAGTEPATS